MGDFAGFCYGTLGGIFGELLVLFELRRQAPKDLPQWLTSWFYWAVTLSMSAAGGLLAIIYLESDISLKPILAVNVGASAPLILRMFVSQTPSIGPGRTD